MVHQWLRNPKAITSTALLLTLLFIIACGASAMGTPPPPSNSIPAATTTVPAADQTPQPTAIPTAAPQTTSTDQTPLPTAITATPRPTPTDQTPLPTAITAAPRPTPTLAVVVQGNRVEIAKFTASDELILPDDMDRWIVLGSLLGSGYSSETGGELQFDPANPGLIQVVQMEPQAYQSFTDNRKYADGSMFLLSFYKIQEKPSPELNGFVQGDLRNIEIHLIDRKKYDDDRAFFFFGKGDKKAAMLPAGNACVQCHAKDGAFDGTFAQFYPTIRHLIPEDSLKGDADNE